MAPRKPRGNDTATTAIAPSGTTHLFTQRERKRPPAMSSERIADDLAAFREAGGRIEVLGTTRSLKKIGVQDADEGAAPTRSTKPIP